MLQSMTGFGKAEGNLANCKLSIQIKSLNSKQADINLKIPSLFKEKEIQIRTLLSNKLERGKVELYASTEDLQENSVPILNESLLISYYHQLKRIAKELGEDSTALIPIVTGFPDIFNSKEHSLSESDWTIFFGTLEAAVENLINFRTEEGQSLAIELTKRIENIRSLLAKVNTYESERIQTVKMRISKNLEEIQAEANKERLEQEMIYYLEKYDITEEKMRLEMHLNYFRTTMKEENSQGKKLGFISQEIGREINTLGAKANHAEIQKVVVQMKDELEKIKEQILNIL